MINKGKQSFVKKFYDGMTIDGYYVSTKYRFLRIKEYYGLYQNKMYFVLMDAQPQIRLYQIKLFGKWFIYRIKKLKPYEKTR